MEAGSHDDFAGDGEKNIVSIPWTKYGGFNMKDPPAYLAEFWWSHEDFLHRETTLKNGGLNMI